MPEPTRTTTRLLALDDVEEMTDLLTANRAFLEPWVPARPDAFFTVAEQTKILELSLAEHDAGRMVPLAILGHDGRLAGQVTLNGIVRGAFQSVALGYWIAEDRNGQGLASAAAGEAVALAFGELDLHRVQAETLLHNTASQRVLAKHGFEQYGMAPNYLKIAGRWQDNLMFQLLAC